MRRSEMQTVTVEREVEIEAVCDGCGITEDDSTMDRLMPVTISVDEGEEGGHTDQLDYCDDCLIERAPALTAAGSRAPIVTGEDPPADEDHK